MGVAYKPYQYDPTIRLYAPVYTRKDGKIELSQVESSYDYTEDKPTNDWYHNPLAKGSSSWVEPYFGEVAQTSLAEYGTTFNQLDPETNKERIAGVVSANYSLDQLKKIMKSLELGKTGYGFIFSEKGKLLYHPDHRLVKQKKLSLI